MPICLFPVYWLLAARKTSCGAIFSHLIEELRIYFDRFGSLFCLLIIRLYSKAVITARTRPPAETKSWVVCILVTQCNKLPFNGCNLLMYELCLKATLPNTGDEDVAAGRCEQPVCISSMNTIVKLKSSFAPITALYCEPEKCKIASNVTTMNPLTRVSPGVYFLMMEPLKGFCNLVILNFYILRNAAGRIYVWSVINPS